MQILTYPLGPVAANCYVLIDKEQALVIDPGASFPELKDILQKYQATLQGILLTHAHFDHMAGVQSIVDEFGCNVYIHDSEYSFLKDPQKNVSAAFGMDVSCGILPKTFHEGHINIGHFSIQVMHTPGHSIGSCIFLIKGQLFTGDTLFSQSIGRCDLYSGNSKQMIQSLQRIALLEYDATIYPGHGPKSTLSFEKENNYDLRYWSNI